MKTFAEAEIFFLSLQSQPPSPYSLHYTPLPPPVFSFPHGELTRLDLKLDDTSQIAACQDAITCKFQFAGSNRSACGGHAEWRGCCGGLGCAVFFPLCAWQSLGWPETSSCAEAFIRVAIRPAQRGFRMRTCLWKGKLCVCVWTVLSFCYRAREFSMQTHAQIRHNPDNPAAALGSQAYCALLKLSFPKVYFTEQRIKEEQRLEPTLFFIIKIFYFFWKNFLLFHQNETESWGMNRSVKKNHFLKTYLCLVFQWKYLNIKI